MTSIKLYHYSNEKNLTIIKANPFAYFSVHPTSHSHFGKYRYVVEFKGFCMNSDYQYNIEHANEIIERVDNNEFVNEEDLEVCFDYDIEVIQIK